MKVKYKIKEEYRDVNWDLIMSAVSGFEKVELGILITDSVFWFVLSDAISLLWNEKMDNQEIQNEICKFITGSPAVFKYSQEHTYCQQIERKERVFPTGEECEDFEEDEEDPQSLFVVCDVASVPYYLNYLRIKYNEKNKTS